MPYQSSYFILDFASIKLASGIPLANDTSTHFYNFTTAISEGQHNLTFYCNDTQGDLSNSNRIVFNTTDQTPPIVQVSLPVNNSEEIDGDITFAYNVSDAVSAIGNCTLEFQSVDNVSNSSITKNRNLSIAINGKLDNGVPYF